MQLDAEPRSESPFQHAFAVHLQNARLRKAAQQCLTHFRRIGAGFGRKQQCLGDGFDVERHDNLIGGLGRLPVAVTANQGDGLPHQLKQRLDALKHLLACADHECQRSRFRADLTTGHGRVDIKAAELFDAPGKFLGGERRNRAHVHDRFAARDSRGNAIIREQHFVDVGRIRDHDENDFGAFCHLTRGGAGNAAFLDHLAGHTAARIEIKLMAGRHEMAGHPPAHNSQPDKAKIHGQALF